MRLKKGGSNNSGDEGVYIVARGTPCQWNKEKLCHNICHKHFITHCRDVLGARAQECLVEGTGRKGYGLQIYHTWPKPSEECVWPLANGSAGSQALP